MFGYFLRRVLQIIPVLFTVSVVTFIMMHLTPGGPWDTAASRPVPAAVRQNILKRFNGDKPLFTQYIDYMANAIRGDLGPSFSGTRTVNQIIADGFPISASLGLGAIILALGVGIPLGVIAALRHNRLIDQAAMLFVTIGISVPGFVLALAAIVLFSVVLRALPYQFQRDEPLSWIMPVVLLALGPTALVLRLTRAATLEVLGEDYVRTARAKGLPATTVNIRHVLRNALLPVITLVGIVTANLITGTFVIESVFAVPGLGRSSVQSIFKRDYGLLMGVTLFYTLIITLANLLVDLTYSFIDPRITRA